MFRHPGVCERLPGYPREQGRGGPGPVPGGQQPTTSALQVSHTDFMSKVII